MFNAFFAAWHAFVQRPMPDAQRFLAAADLTLETTFPFLFFVSLSFVIPPTVFSFVPLKTDNFASFPRATFELFFAFMAFIAFIAFMAFPAFMAFMAFAFMVFAFIAFI